MKTAYLGLGSNLGDRLGLLREALRRLRLEPQIRIERISAVYETKPVGFADQPDFLNVVAKLATSCEPRALLELALSVETALGRERHERWGPRTLDIDLLWFEGVRSDDPLLTLPHPRMKERGFVLGPLAEIAPELELDGERVDALAARLGSRGLTRLGSLEELAPAT